jgi:phosphoribosylamine-glycine ligase
MIIKDDTPYYPLEEEEARQLLFDFNKDIVIKPDALKKGKNNITVFVELSWGKHEFIEKNILKKESNIQQIEKD